MAVRNLFGIIWFMRLPKLLESLAILYYIIYLFNQYTIKIFVLPSGHKISNPINK